MNLSNIKNLLTSRKGIAAGAAVLSAAATAAWVEARARRAEREHPPTGRLLDIDGVVLHCVERGEGPPVVLIHGNTVSHRDFEASGLIDRLAVHHRVIAFDRPGFGHSSRPRDRLWTPSAQAALLQAAFAPLGIERPIVVGHSMGSMVALAMALDFPADVHSLVLLGGYYYPGLRVDALLTAPVALPVIGDVMRYTVTALSGRLLLDKLVQGMFAPEPVPPAFFQALSREMMLRPAQIRANAEDAAFMIGQAKASSDRHHELRLPVALFAGDQDLVVDPQDHSGRLHDELAQSTLTLVEGAGHMVHHVAADRVLATIEALRVEPGAAPQRAAARGASASDASASDASANKAAAAAAAAA